MGLIRFSCFTLLAIIHLQTFAQPRYRTAPGDPNGIDKWYMGRQIAHVMSHYGIPWLERAERQEEEDTDLLLRNLGLKNGMQVADLSLINTRCCRTHYRAADLWV